MAGRIAVIGDVMLDKYRYCTARENPERPSAPCYTVRRKDYKPGGAGNVAANLATLGADFKLIGLMGDDHYARVLEDILLDLKVPCEFIKDPKRMTIVKERLFVDNDYQCRIDEEEIEYIEENHVQEIMKKIRDVDLILVSDYRKGMISKNLMESLKTKNIPIIVDVKPQHIDLYRNVFLIKPNSKEACEMTGINDDILASEMLIKNLNANVLLTRGANGISYFGLNGERYNFPVEKTKVVDVTGAGDTTIATFANFLIEGFNIADCTLLANRAGGISVSYPGCYHITKKEILRE